MVQMKLVFGRGLVGGGATGIGTMVIMLSYRDYLPGGWGLVLGFVMISVFMIITGFALQKIALKTDNNFCTNCGTLIQPDAIFCTHCGKPVYDK